MIFVANSALFAEILQLQYGGRGRIKTYCMSGHVLVFLGLDLMLGLAYPWSNKILMYGWIVSLELKNLLA